MFKRNLLLIVILLGSSRLCGQIIKGNIKDSILKSSIISSTVTIYNVRDSTILKYGFTNNFGNFRFESLPFDTTMELRVAHVGYSEFKTRFKLTPGLPQLDLKTIYLKKKITQLDEVVIVGQRPPMIMKGDTLEINPEAFKTKENAVVEDLLRKVPGVIIWSDGRITVNGKKVSQLYVEGKPFFGGDPVVAIRNLPKDAVDKVRVYDDRPATSESKTEANVIMDVTLKKGSKSGLFGKLGGGLGSNDRFEGNAAVNAFSPKNQVSILVATNNTNKEIFNVQDMLKQTVYRPGGNDNTSYQSNFSIEGLNRFNAKGVSFNRDWSAETNSNTQYFEYRAKNKTEKMLQGITLVDENALKQDEVSSSENYHRNQKINGNLRSKSNKHEFNLVPTLESDESINSSRTNSLTSRSDTLLNENINARNGDSKVKRLNLSAEYINKDAKLFAQNFKLEYKIFADKSDELEQLNTTFSTIDSEGQMKPSFNMNRQRAITHSAVNHLLYGEVNLQKLMRLRMPYGLKFTNTFTRDYQNKVQQVKKYNPFDERYSISDIYLSNHTNTILSQGRPGVEMNGFFKKAAIRETIQFNWSAKMESQFLNQDNKSQKTFQQISRNYTTYLPSAFFLLSHQKAGKFNKSYTVRYGTEVQIPNVNQLAPLIDSAYQNYLYVGNINLRKEYRHQVDLSYQNFKGNNRGMIKLDMSLGTVNNRLVDSSSYDSVGRQIASTGNAQGYRFLNASLIYEKSGMLFNKPYGINLIPRINLSRNPYYVNDVLRISKNSSYSFLGIANYTQNDLLLYDLISQISINRSAVENNSSHTILNSFHVNTGGSIQLSWPKRTTIVNTISYDLTTSSYDNKIENVIWNVNIYYRMLKKETLEVKLTAADLLRQRTNVIRYLNDNTIRMGTVNNLQQYFMMSLSFYPRQFGIKKAKK